LKVEGVRVRFFGLEGLGLKVEGVRVEGLSFFGLAGLGLRFKRKK
jgi:hypothetical protein